MQISKIKISNILGIEELEFDPNGFTVIDGANGTGKTSVLEAVRAALQGGHDATLLRAGAEKGEIVLVLDDGREITRRVTESTSTTDVRVDGKKITRPVESIQRLTDMLSVNPIEFLTARKQDRVKVLLEAMPLKLDVDALATAAGIPVHAQVGSHALTVIDTVRKQVYEDRTGTNRAIKEKEATINQIQLAMPDGVAGVDGDEKELNNKIQLATTTRDTTLSKILTKMDGIQAEEATTIAAIREKLQIDIDALKTDAQSRVDIIKAATNENFIKAEAAKTKAKDAYQTAVVPLQIALQNIVANRSAVAKREQAQETITRMQEELKGLVDDAAAQTTALSDIDTYKNDLLADLPIPGIEIRDGEIYQGDVPLDRLNTAAQVQIAVSVAKLRAGELGVVCVDRIESLDSETFQQFRDAVAGSGLQLFVTRVGDGEFSINSDD